MGTTAPDHVRGRVASSHVIAVDGTELVGYAASALVVASLAMTSVVRLRILSLVGSVTFVVYGALIGSVPIMVTNAAIAALNVWFLRKEFGSGTSGGVDLGASLIRADSPFLIDFLAFHRDDIDRFQPDFEMPTAGDVIALLLTRDGLPAGVLVGRRIADCLHIDLDYVLSAYRDSRIGRWIFGDDHEVFTALGISRLIAHAHTDTHRKYLERVGFRHVADDQGGHYTREW